MLVKRNESLYVRKFFHYGLYSKNIGWITACAEYQIEPEKGHTLSIGYSFCSPKEKFSRKRGCLISSGRMEKKPIVIPWDGSVKPGQAAFAYLCSSIETVYYYKRLAIKEYNKEYDAVNKGSTVHLWLLDWVADINEELENAPESTRLPSLNEIENALQVHRSEVKEADEWRPLAKHVHDLIVACVEGSRKQ